jgi:hypothetical protein
MTNREKKIVSLLEEGFSYDTIKKMSDTHINMLYNKLVKEAVVRVAADKYDEIKDKLSDTDTVEVTEDDAALDKIAGIDPNEDPNPEGNEDGPSDNMNANDGMSIDEDFFGDINEDEVLEALFGKPKKKMKTPITTLGMFEGKKEKYNPWAVCTSSLGLEGKKREDYTKDESKKFERCVQDVKKQEQKEDKVRQIEESIVSLIKKTQGKVLTKKDILSEEPKIAPAIPTVKPGVKPERGTPYQPKHSPKPKAGTEVKPARPTVKPGVKPERGTPYQPKHSPKPKAGTEVKPARPTVKPGVKPERGTPYQPKHSPKPKAGNEGGLPEFLTFNNLNIKFRDE